MMPWTGLPLAMFLVTHAMYRTIWPMTASGVFGALELEHIEAAVGVGGEDVDEAAAGGHLDTMQEQRRQIG